MSGNVFRPQRTTLWSVRLWMSDDPGRGGAPRELEARILLSAARAPDLPFYYVEFPDGGLVSAGGERFHGGVSVEALLTLATRGLVRFSGEPLDLSTVLPVATAMRSGMCELTATGRAEAERLKSA